MIIMSIMNIMVSPGSEHRQIRECSFLACVSRGISSVECRNRDSLPQCTNNDRNEVVSSTSMHIWSWANSFLAIYAFFFFLLTTR